jgi:hypothetical protein
VIYADPSFLFSLYATDAQSAKAEATYHADGRRPLLFTPWQRFELRNAIRLASQRYTSSGQAVPFRVGNVFKLITDDLDAGILQHEEPAWRDTFRLAEELSSQHTDRLGCAAVDLWHVANAIVLEADTFWTFDTDQHALAVAVRRFRKLPWLTA